MRANNTIYIWHEQAITEWSWRGSSADINLWTIEHDDERTRRVSVARDLYFCLWPTMWSFAHMPFGLSDRNSIFWLSKNLILAWFAESWSVGLVSLFSRDLRVSVKSRSLVWKWRFVCKHPHAAHTPENRNTNLIVTRTEKCKMD